MNNVDKNRGGRPPVTHLTDRDVQVARLVAQGYERDQVASRLALTRSAVNRHMTKVMVLTGSDNGVQAIARLVGLDIIRAADATGRETQIQRDAEARRLRPGFRAVQTGTDNRSRFLAAAAYVRSQKPVDPEHDVDEHVCQLLDTIADELAGMA